MPKLPVLKPREALRVLERAGFYIDRITGSHYILINSGYPKKRITLPHHNRDLAPGTIASIIKQSGLPLEKFLDLI